MLRSSRARGERDTSDSFETLGLRVAGETMSKGGSEDLSILDRLCQGQVSNKECLDVVLKNMRLRFLQGDLGLIVIRSSSSIQVRKGQDRSKPKCRLRATGARSYDFLDYCAHCEGRKESLNRAVRL